MKRDQSLNQGRKYYDDNEAVKFKICLGAHINANKQRQTYQHLHTSSAENQQCFNKKSYYTKTSQMQVEHDDNEEISKLLNIEPLQYKYECERNQKTTNDVESPQETFENDRKDVVDKEKATSEKKMQSNTASACKNSHVKHSSRNSLHLSTAITHTANDNATFEDVHALLDDNFFLTHSQIPLPPSSSSSSPSSSSSVVTIVPKDSSKKIQRSRTRKHDVGFVLATGSDKTHNYMLRERLRNAAKNEKACRERSSEELLLNIERANMQRLSTRSLSPVKARGSRAITRTLPCPLRFNDTENEQSQTCFSQSLHEENAKQIKERRYDDDDDDVDGGNKPAWTCVDDVTSAAKTIRNKAMERMRQLLQNEVDRADCETHGIGEQWSAASPGDNDTRELKVAPTTRLHELRVQVFHTIHSELQVLMRTNESEQCSLIQDITDLRKQCCAERSALSTRRRKELSNASSCRTRIRGHSWSRPAFVVPSARHQRLKEPMNSSRSKTNASVSDAVFRVRLLRNLVQKHTAQLFLLTLAHRVALHKRREQLVTRFARRTPILVHHLSFSVWQEYCSALTGQLTEYAALLVKKTLHCLRKRMWQKWCEAQRIAKRKHRFFLLAVRAHLGLIFHRWRLRAHRFMCIRDTLNSFLLYGHSKSCQSSMPCSNLFVTFKQRCRDHACGHSIWYIGNRVTSSTAPHGAHMKAASSQSLECIGDRIHAQRLRYECWKKWHIAQCIRIRAHEITQYCLGNRRRTLFNVWRNVVDKYEHQRQSLRRHMFQLWCLLVRQRFMMHVKAILRRRLRAWRRIIVVKRFGTSFKLQRIFCVRQRTLHQWIVATSRRVRVRRCITLLDAYALQRAAYTCLHTWRKCVCDMNLLERVFTRAELIWRKQWRERAQNIQSNSVVQYSKVIALFSLYFLDIFITVFMVLMCD